MTQIYGELPTSPVIYAACDSGYFIDHALPFAVSSSEAGFDTHVHITNPTPEVFSHCGIINSCCDNRVTYTFDDVNLSELPEESQRAFYACLRFHVLPNLLPSATKVLTLDIDCLVMKSFEFPETPCGYFPRPNEEHPGMRVAAGAVYMTNESKNIAESISIALNTASLEWFVDQMALSHVFDQVPSEFITCFDNEFMDWDFVEGTAIWTGKGPRKFDNTTYVAKKTEFNQKGLDKVESAKSVILKPRLDIPFKRFGLERASNHIPEIREHWKNFANKINADLEIELPRWMFNSTIEQSIPKDAELLVPHVEKHNWGGEHENTLFYMQTVFPWLFTIDKKGWSGGAEFVETFNPDDVYSEESFDKMRRYIARGGTKFAQPASRAFKVDEPFIFVPLQIPHDETIKYHSDVGVVEMVKALCEWADSNESNPRVIFKGHPINLQSMEESKSIIEKCKRADYHTDLNIHDVIPEADAVYIINSGTGQESMLHDASVVCFGDCEYQDAVIRGDLDDLDNTWKHVQGDDKVARAHLYRKWYHWYLNKVTFNTVITND